MLKSTEIVIEQLIIGLLVFVIVALFVWGAPLPRLDTGDSAYQSFFLGVLVVIAAYAVGIVVDRWSDTLLEQLERRSRIHIYLNEVTYDALERLTPQVLPHEPLLKLKIRKNQDGISEYHDYLRRRMRITRSLACLLPALFLGLALLDIECEKLNDFRQDVGFAVLIIYAAVVVCSIFLKRLLPDQYRVPKTHKIEDLRKFIVAHKPDKKTGNKSEQQEPEIKIEFRPTDLINPAVLGLMLFVLLKLGTAIGLYSVCGPADLSTPAGLMFGGLIVTVLVGWAWWRISKTYFALLLHYEQLNRA